MQGRGNSEDMGGSGHNQLPTMTFCLLPDFLAQWAENISEADFFS